MIHNPQHYVRDFYFFKRSQYPQLALVHKKPEQAYIDLQRECLTLKFTEIGKVMLIWGILKNVNQVNNILAYYLSLPFNRTSGRLKGNRGLLPQSCLLLIMFMIILHLCIISLTKQLQ